MNVDLVREVDELRALYRLTDRLYRANGLEEVYSASLDAITDVLGCSRASVLIFDADAVMRFVAHRGLSERYRTAVDGHSPWKAGDVDPEPIFVEDIKSSGESDWIKSVVLEEKIRGLAFIPLVCQRAVVGKFMAYFSAPHLFSEREVQLAVTIARQVGFSIERARSDEGRRRAEAEHRKSEERFRDMVENAPVMIWTSDPQGKCAHLNKMLREFWSVSEGEIPEFDFTSTIHPDDSLEIIARMTEAAADRKPVTLVGRYRDSSGRYRILHTDARPRLSAAGEFLGMIGVNVDETDRWEAETQRELLLAELNHRVKNTLAVVQSLAAQTFRGGRASPDALKAYDGRLRALAAAHTHLTRTQWESAPILDLAKDVLGPELAGGERIQLTGSRILLEPKKALALAMALHELLTNALKYGSLSNQTGTVHVDWTTSTPTSLSILWQERGGPVVAPPDRKGFGSRLLEQELARDLDGTISVEFAADGLLCSIIAPLDESVRPAKPGLRFEART